MARSSLFEREAVLDERLLLRDSLRRGMGETTYAQVRAEFEARQQRGDFLSTESHKYASSRSFTTPETIAAERANIAQVQAGKNTVPPIMSAELAEKEARSRDFLNDSQRSVIEQVLNSTDRIQGLQGKAGTGKTTVLSSIREGAEKSGLTVEGFAPTSRAAGQLREAGIDASTLQSFLARRTESGGPEPAASTPLYARRVESCQHPADAGLSPEAYSKRPCSGDRGYRPASGRRRWPSVPADARGRNADCPA